MATQPGAHDTLKREADGTAVFHRLKEHSRSSTNPASKAPCMIQGRSSKGVAESTTVHDTRLGLGLGWLKGDEGDSRTGAVGLAEGVGVGVDRVDLEILVLPLKKYVRARL